MGFQGNARQWSVSVASAAVGWALAHGPVDDALVLAVDVRTLLAGQIAYTLAGLGAVAHGWRAVRRVAQAVGLAPAVHPGYTAVPGRRDANLRSDDERKDVVGGAQVPDVQQEGVVRAGELWRQPAADGRGDAQVGAVAEGLGLAAADRLGAVGARPPHVACETTRRRARLAFSAPRMFLIPPAGRPGP